MERMRVRTDLALEAKESFAGSDVEVHGVVVEEEYDKEQNLRLTRVRIESERGAREMGKPIGTYLTLEAPGMASPDEDYHREISEKLAEYLTGCGYSDGMMQKLFCDSWMKVVKACTI